MSETKNCECCGKPLNEFNIRAKHTLCKICYAKKNGFYICPDCDKVYRPAFEAQIYCGACGLKRHKDGTLP